MFPRWFFQNPSRTITSAAVVIGATTTVSRILGLLRDRVLAGEFGASDTLDTYYAAFRLPDLIFNLIVVGALSAGFIPVFSAAYQGDRSVDRQHAWRLVNGTVNTLIVGIGLLAVVLLANAEPLTRMVTPGFSPAQIQQAASLTRIMLLSPLLLGVSAVLGGVLQSLKLFFAFSLAPIFYNVGIICGALFLVPWLGVAGLAWGVVLGALLHLVIQLPAVLAAGYRYRPQFGLRDPELREIFRLMGPRTLNLAVNQLNLLAITMVATLLPSGSLAVFTFANNLQSFPLGIFGISFAIAAFPALTELINRPKEFAMTLGVTARQILFLVLPAAVLLLLLRAQLVRVLLGSGRFDWEDTIATMDTLAVFTLSLFAQALLPLLIRAFYAHRDSLTPFLVSAGGAALNLALAIVLPRLWLPWSTAPLGVVGLALAFTIATVVQFSFLWLLLRWRYGPLDEAVTGRTVLKIAAGMLAMAGVVQAFKQFAAPAFGTATFLGVAIQGAVAAVLGVSAYLAVCLRLKAPEAQALLAAVRRRAAPSGAGVASEPSASW